MIHKTSKIEIKPFSYRLLSRNIGAGYEEYKKTGMKNSAKDINETFLRSFAFQDV